jgi:hypothetical protein
MASKKTVRSKGKGLRKSKPRSKSANFPCPNPDDPLSLTEIVDRMEDDPAFAKFISGLLHDSYSDADARACLASYFEPTTAELTDLCIPKGCQKKMFCTVPPPTNTTTRLLIAVPARRFSKKR